MPEVERVVARILEARGSAPPERCLLVAVSGIDGSGKGWVTARIVETLRERGLRASGITIDGWLNLPARRFSRSDPGRHFYEHAIRFEEMFERLVLPLRDRRSVRVEADYAEETATAYRPHLYDYQDLEVVVLEGIFLLKRSLRRHYDLSIWIDCTFETALERAIARAQEGLPPAETARAYRTIYFPAQEIHLRRDQPRSAATLILANDPRLRSAGTAPAARSGTPGG
jgi:uridine kinase